MIRKMLIVLVGLIMYNLAAAQSLKLVVLDIDYSMAYHKKYIITLDSLTVIFGGGLVGEKPRYLFRKALSTPEREKLCLFIEKFPLDTLQALYDGSMLDGDRKVVKIEFNGKSREIEINNFYHKDFTNLFTFINTMMPATQHILYEPMKTNW